MKTNVFLHIAIRIIILFTIGMFMTFVPELLRDFFGDTPHVCTRKFCNEQFDIDWNWGKRHYWYNTMMMLLFMLGLVNVVVSIIKILNKNYKL